MPSTHRYTLPVAGDDTDRVSARLWAAGALGLWERGGASCRELVAWFTDDRAAVPAGGRWTPEPDRDWQAEWKATIAPVRAGRFVVTPTWLAGQPRPFDAEVVVLDPGRAFGSGHHATTALCLELLSETDLAGRTVADIGCGTGVLAIAAARCGARVVAVDIDPDAIEVTRQNAERNRVEVAVRVGSVGDVPGPVDVVVANLVTDTVVALAPDLAALAGDRLIVSGVASERAQRVADALAAAGLYVREVRGRDGWVALVARPGHGGHT